MFTLAIIFAIFIALFLFDIHPLLLAIITGFLAVFGFIGWGVTAFLLGLYFVVEVLLAIARG